MTLDDIRDRTVITVTEAAELLELDARTVRRGLENGDLPGVRVGQRWVIPVAHILPILEPARASLLDGLLTVSVPEAGHALGIGRDAAYAAANAGEIPTLRLGRSIRVPVPKLLALLSDTPTTNTTLHTTPNP